MTPHRRTCCEGRRIPWRRASAAWAAQPAEAPGRPLLSPSLSLTLPPRHPPQGALLRRADGACRSASSGSACIMIGFFMTFAAMAEGREDLAGPFIFLMIVGGLIGRIAKSRR